MQKKKTDEFPSKWELHIKQFPGKNEMKKTKQKKHWTNSASPVSLNRKVSKNMHDPQYI